MKPPISVILPRCRSSAACPNTGAKSSYRVITGENVLASCSMEAIAIDKFLVLRSEDVMVAYTGAVIPQQSRDLSLEARLDRQGSVADDSRDVVCYIVLY